MIKKSDVCFCFQFKAQGLMIIAKNYLEVYPYEKWNAKVGGTINQIMYMSWRLLSAQFCFGRNIVIFSFQIIPVFDQGDTFHPSSIQVSTTNFGRVIFVIPDHIVP